MNLLAVDLGSTHLKCGLYDEELRPVGHAVEPIELFVDGPRVESDPASWWSALCAAVPRVLREASVAPEAVAAVSFCAQMQGVVLVDEALEPLRRSIGYLDTRATELFAEEMQGGWPKVEGVNALKLLRSVRATNIAPGTPKDPLWKVRWLARHEPHVLARARAWLDVKDYLVARCTGRACTTADSAHLSCLYRFDGAASRYDPGLCRMYGVEARLLPEVVPGNRVVGPLLQGAAGELGLAPGTPVVPGGGDISCVAFGAGAVEEGDTHVYVGTSGWVAQTTGKRALDTAHYIATLRTCLPAQNLYMGELQTAGLCLSWLARALEGDSAVVDYAALESAAKRSVPGAAGLLFAPWLHGSRSPNEDPRARGMFMNLGLAHQRDDLVRAVYEGVALHLGWILEAIEERMPALRPLRFVGGGARSPLWGQLLADATAKEVLTFADPQQCGARGAAFLGLAALEPQTDVKTLAGRLEPERRYRPQPENTALLRARRARLQELYRANKKLFRAMAAG